MLSSIIHANQVAGLFHKSQEGKCMYHFEFLSMQIDMETRKQTKFFDLNCDNSEDKQKTGTIKFLKNVIIGFYEFYVYQY